jgi:hypothetical protein
MYFQWEAFLIALDSPTRFLDTYACVWVHKEGGIQHNAF